MAGETQILANHIELRYAQYERRSSADLSGVAQAKSEALSKAEGGIIEHPVSSIENPVSRIQYQESRIEHRVSSIKNRASSIQNRATIYSKQSQFAGHSNEHNLLINKGL